MMNFLLRTGAMVLSMQILAHAVYAQCESLRQNDGKSLITPSARDRSALDFVNQNDFEKSSRGGCRGQVYVCSGSMMYGDLLSVHDNVLSVYVYPDFSNSLSPHLSAGTHNIDLKEITKVVVKGRSKILPGVFIGFLGGMLAGSVMTRIIERRTPADDLFGPGALGGMGLLMGATIGSLSSSRDLEITKFEGNNIGVLNALCRYPSNGAQ